MDLAKAGFYIGVLALLLAVPLAVIANLATPQVTAWWSTTSQKRMRRRIANLRELLAESEREWKFSAAEWQTYKTTAIFRLAVLGMVQGIFLVVVNVLFVVLLIGTAAWHANTTPMYRMTDLGAGVISGMVYGLAMMALATYSSVKILYEAMGRNYEIHSIPGQEAIKKELAELLDLEEKGQRS